MPENYSSVGFHVSKSFLSWVMIEQKHDKTIEVKNLDFIPFSSSLDFSNLLTQNNRIKIVEAIEKIASGEHFRLFDARLSIDSTLAYILKIPWEQSLNAIERENQLEWEFSTLMGDEKISDYYLFSHPLDFKSRNGSSSAIVLFIKKQIYLFFKNIFEDFKIPITICDVDHFALENSCSHNYADFQNSNSILISIKDRTIELSFILNGQYFNYRRFQLNDKMSKAEFYEKEILPYFDKEITSIFNKIFLFSDTLSSRAVKEFSKISPITIELINPFKNFIINKSVLNLPSFNELNRFAPAVGIALRGI